MLTDFYHLRADRLRPGYLVTYKCTTNQHLYPGQRGELVPLQMHAVVHHPRRPSGLDPGERGLSALGGAPDMPGMGSTIIGDKVSFQYHSAVTQSAEYIM